MKRYVVLLTLIVGALAACQPTGSPRCDAQWDILNEIESHGYTIDCTPDFDNVAGSGPEAGRTISGWADHDRRTIWIWPEELRSDARLRKTLWHELGHVTGIRDEADAERYSYCREAISGLAYSFPTFPTATDCTRLGG